MPHTVSISRSRSLSAAYRYLRKFRSSDLVKVEVFKPHIVGIVQSISWLTFDFMLQLYHVYRFRIEEVRSLGHVFSEDPNTPEKWLWHGVTLSAQRLTKKVRRAVFGCFGRRIFVFECLIEDDQDEIIAKSQLVRSFIHSETCKGVVSERWDRQNLSGWGENDSLAVMIFTWYHRHCLMEEDPMISYYGVAPSFSFNIWILGRLCRDNEVVLEMLNRMGLRWTWFLVKFMCVFFFVTYQVCSMWPTWDKWL